MHLIEAKEEFHLPAPPVELGDEFCGEGLRALVGHQQEFFALRRLDPDQPHTLAAVTAFAPEIHPRLLHDARCLISRAQRQRLVDFHSGTLAQAQDEGTAQGLQLFEKSVVFSVVAVAEIGVARLPLRPPSLPLADFPGSDGGLHRQVFEHVQAEVQAHRSLLSMLARQSAQGMRGSTFHSVLSTINQRWSPRGVRRGGRPFAAVAWDEESSVASSVKTFSRSFGSSTACASEKLPKLTERPQTSRCSRARSLASQSPRMVRTAGLSSPKRNRPR